MNGLNFRSRFLVKNLVKGFLAVMIIVIIYILLQKFTDFEVLLDTIGQWPVMVYMVFIFSEIVFGIVPPELFMIWSINSGVFDSYLLDILLLTSISYLAGVSGYFIGDRLRHFSFFQSFFYRYINRYRNILNKYAGFLIVVASLTPLPFSAVCMLVGTTNYNFFRFLLIAMTRFIRFGVYSFFIYQANI